jgi:hypothetical protein
MWSCDSSDLTANRDGFGKGYKCPSKLPGNCCPEEISFSRRLSVDGTDGLLVDVIDSLQCCCLILGNCSPEEMSGSGPLQPDGADGPGGQLYQWVLPGPGLPGILEISVTKRSQGFDACQLKLSYFKNKTLSLLHNVRTAHSM